MATKEEVMAALRNCYDPEIPLSIVDLGLVYDVDILEDIVRVRMTLTAPGCPLHSTIARSVEGEIEKIEGVGKAEVEVVWQPPWTPERMSPEARKKLGWSK
ncbi:MAG: metal-sulfur cluster assembly factor [Dehalococcoidia bacterium]